LATAANKTTVTTIPRPVIGSRPGDGLAPLGLLLGLTR
jgi:hypothetical protein